MLTSLFHLSWMPMFSSTCCTLFRHIVYLSPKMWLFGSWLLHVHITSQEYNVASRHCGRGQSGQLPPKLWTLRKISQICNFGAENPHFAGNLCTKSKFWKIHNNLLSEILNCLSKNCTLPCLRLNPKCR